MRDSTTTIPETVSAACPAAYEPARRLYKSMERVDDSYETTDGIRAGWIESVPDGLGDYVSHVALPSPDRAYAYIPAAVLADRRAQREVARLAPTPKPEWRSPRGLTLTEEMDRADSDY